MEDRSPDEGFDDEGGTFRAPLPPADRIWRHPSELDLPPVTAPAPTASPARRSAGWGIGLVSAVTASALTVGMLAAVGALDPPAPEAARPAVTQEIVVPVALDDDPPVSDTVRIAEELSPAIVRIVVETRSGGTGGGSGVVFRDDGHLITNAHVVEDASRITVVLAGGDELDARLVGADDDTDIAVVKIDGDDTYPVAVMGTAVNLRIGEPTIAIGSPLGLVGGSSVTTGVVSQLGRVVQARDRSPLLDMIQTDAAIAPGSSGGALLDGNGSVIGITTAIAVSEAGAEGLGFAVPVDLARDVAEDIIATGGAVHVWLGIEGTGLASERAGELGLPGGALVRSVVEQSPAEAAGLQPDDIILSVGGRLVRSMSDLVVVLRRMDPGDGVQLGLWRDGERMRVDVVLAERP